jgi:hypothetical protein
MLEITIGLVMVQKKKKRLSLKVTSLIENSFEKRREQIKSTTSVSLLFVSLPSTLLCRSFLPWSLLLVGYLFWIKGFFSLDMPS